MGFVSLNGYCVYLPNSKHHHLFYASLLDLQDCCSNWRRWDRNDHWLNCVTSLCAFLAYSLLARPRGKWQACSVRISVLHYDLFFLNVFFIFYPFSPQGTLMSYSLSSWAAIFISAEEEEGRVESPPSEGGDSDPLVPATMTARQERGHERKELNKEEIKGRDGSGKAWRWHGE